MATTPEELKAAAEAQAKREAEEKARLEAEAKAKAEADAAAGEGDDDVNLDKVGIKVDKLTYSPEEVQTLIAEATRKGAKISKDQLHKEIEKQKSEAQRLDGELKKLQEAQKAQQSQQDQQKSAEAEAQLKAQLEEVSKKLELMETSVVDQAAKAQELEARLQAEKLMTYAQQRIAEAQGRIIPELVRGNSKDEIDKAVQLAKARFEEIELSLKNSLKLPSATLQSTTGADQQTQESQQTQVERVEFKNMRDRDLYKAKRAEILQKIYAEAGFPVKT